MSQVPVVRLRFDSSGKQINSRKGKHAAKFEHQTTQLEDKALHDLGRLFDALSGTEKQVSIVMKKIRRGNIKDTELPTTFTATNQSAAKELEASAELAKRLASKQLAA